MASVGDRFRDLQREGTLAGEGGFSLDRARAREKLRAFQLAAPHEYVLLVVEAAVLRGASAIAIEVDADDVRFTFDATFEREEIEQLYPSIFADVADRRLQARQALALAINAAMALGPAFVRLECGDGKRGFRASFASEGADAIDAVDGVAAGTRLHVRDRFRLGFLIEVVRSLGGAVAEAMVLRERCRYASIPITLNGKAIAFGLGEGDLVAAVTIDERSLRGVVGFAAGEGAAEVEILTSGVTIETMPLEGAPAGLRARIDSAAIRKDLSQKGIVRDAAFKAAIGAVRGAIVPAIQRFAGALHAGDAAARRLGPGSIVAWLLEQRSSALLRRIIDGEEFAALRELEIWRLCGGRPISTAALAAAREIPYTTDAFEGPPPEPWTWIVDGRRAERVEALQRIFGARLINVTARLAAEVERARCRERFLARHHRGVLPDGYYLARWPIDRDEMRGEVAIRGLGSDRSQIELVHFGSLLCALDLELPMAGLHAVVESPRLRPTESYEAAVPDAALAAALVAVLEAVELALVTIADGRRHADRVGAYVRWVLAGDHVAAFLLAARVGFSKRALPELLAADPTAARLARGAAAWSWRGESIHPFARAPALRDVRGHEHSLAALQAKIDREGRLRFVRYRDDIRIVGDVLPVDEAGERLLAALFGRKALDDAAADLARAAAEARLLAGPRLDLRPGRRLLCEVPIAAAGATGIVGLRDPADGWSERGLLRILKRGRLLEERRLITGFPGIWAAVDGEALTLTEAGGADEAQAIAIEDAVRDALPALALAVLAGLGGVSSAEARPWNWFLLHVVKAAIGEAPRLDLFARWSAAGELALWRRFIALEDEVGAAAMSRALNKPRRRDEALTIDGLRRALPGKRKRRAGRGDEAGEALRQALVPALPGIFDRVRLPGHGGARVPLAQVIEALVAGRPIDTVHEDMSDETCLDRPVLQLDAELRDLVGDLVGAARLRDVGDEVRDLQIQGRLAQRPALARLGLPERATLFKIALEGDADGFDGEVGLGRAKTARIDVCRGQRHLVTQEPALPLPLQAIVDAADLEVTAALDGLTAAGQRRVDRCLRRSLGVLLRRLAAAWRELPRASADALAPALLQAIVDGRGRGRGRGPEVLSAVELGLVAEIPLFPTLSGPRSLAELDAAVQTERQLLTIDEPWLGPAPARLVVDRREPVIDAAVKALFRRSADFAAIWRRDEVRRRRKEAAPTLAKGPPADALVSEPIASHGLHGVVWLASGAAGVACGEGGKVVGVHALAELIGVGGAVEGGGVIVDADWTDMSLGPGSQKALLHAAIALYRRVLADVRGALGRGEAPSPAALRLLQAQVLGLQREGRMAIQRGRLGELYRELCEVPLFTAGGFLISLQTALDELPAELRHLGLWTLEDEEAARAARAARARAREAQQARAREAQRARAKEAEQSRAKEAEQARAKEAEQSRARAREPEAAPEPDSEIDAEIVEDTAPAPRRPPPPPSPRRSQPKRTPAALPTPSPEERLLALVITELRIVLRLARATLDLRDLMALQIADVGGDALVREVDGALVLARAHPVVAALLRGEGGPEVDPLRVSAVVSAAYSGLARLHEAIVDEHEERFHRAHVDHLLAALALQRG